MPIFEYKCENGHRFEKMTTIAKREEPQICDCGVVGKFVISCPTIALDGTDPGFPSAYDKWAKTHEEQAKRPEPVNLREV